MTHVMSFRTNSNDTCANKPKSLLKGASDNLMTLENIVIRPSRTKNNETTVHQLKIISFTHKTISLDDLSRFFIDESVRNTRLSFLKEAASLHEIFYLATCNRIEFIFTVEDTCDKQFLKFFFKKLNADWTAEEVDFAVQHAKVYEGDLALHHIFSVASSLDSMVVGEREIITQVRKAYDECNDAGLTGDFLRLVIRSTVITAKQVFTETKIATHPVSIVSLAYRKLRDMNAKLDSKILMIGSGETNSNLSKYLVKHGFRNFTIFNRTLDRADKLSASLRSENVKVTTNPLSELGKFDGGFDVLITCTSSAEPIVTQEIYQKLLRGDDSKKIIIDLALPADVDKKVIEQNNVQLIDINMLKAEAAKNMGERHNELKSAESIIGGNILEFHQVARIRKLELAMKGVPEKIRDIKSRAMNDVFAKEISTMDEHSKDVLYKVLDYMEKKCISVPMLMAKEIILDTD